MLSSRRRTALFLVAVTACAALSACGKNDPGSSESASGSKTADTPSASAAGNGTSSTSTRDASGTDRKCVGQFGTPRSVKRPASGGLGTIALAGTRVRLKAVKVARYRSYRDKFSNGRLVKAAPDSIFVAVTYNLSNEGNRALEPAADVNSRVVLRLADGRESAVVDGEIGCGAASASYAAAHKLDAFPENDLRSKITGTTAAVYLAPRPAQTYLWVDRQSNRAQDLAPLAAGR